MFIMKFCVISRFCSKIRPLPTFLQNQSRWDRSNHRFERVNNAPREIDFNPNIPIGPADKLAGNAYWQRDLRRAVVPDYTVTAQKLLSAAGQGATASKIPPRPGKTMKVVDNTAQYFPDHNLKVKERLETYGETWP